MRYLLHKISVLCINLLDLQTKSFVTVRTNCWHKYCPEATLQVYLCSYCPHKTFLFQGRVDLGLSSFWNPLLWYLFASKSMWESMGAIWNISIDTLRDINDKKNRQEKESNLHAYVTCVIMLTSWLIQIHFSACPLGCITLIFRIFLIATLHALQISLREYAFLIF